MTTIDIEDMALLEDEISQLRSENEYLKIALDGANYENEQLKQILRPMIPVPMHAALGIQSDLPATLT